MKTFRKRILAIIICMAAGIGCAIAQTDTKRHTVERGETLQSIAKLYGTTQEKLVEQNPSAAQFVYVGMELIIPGNQHKNVSTPKPSAGFPKAHDKKTVTASTKFNFDNTFNSTSTQYSSDPLLFSSGNTDGSAIDLFLSVQLNCGTSTFGCSGVSVNGKVSYGGEVQLQLYKTAGKLKGYYSQFGIGYNTLGAYNLTMNYIQARILPIGYTLPITEVTNCVFKVGGYVAMPLNDLKSNKYSQTYNANFDYGIDAGIAMDYKLFTIGATVQYGFADVSNNPNKKLNNQAILGYISYKIGKF